MRIYLTADGQSFWGPMDLDTARREVASGVIPGDAKWIYATGQTQGFLRSTPHLFSPMESLPHEAGSDIPAGLRTLGSAQASQPLPPSVELLSILGGLWLFLTLVGAVMIVWQYGKVETGYREEVNVVAWAIAITSVMQGFLVYAVCRVLADVRIRLERLIEAK